MREPTTEQLGLLKGFERTAFAVADKVNRDDRYKRVAHAFLRTVGAGWVYHCTKNILHVYGEENLRAVPADRGVMVVSNHRSFFDMYVLSCVMLRRTSWIERMYFPVRSDYFYERPDGVAVNAVMSAFAMYPPVLRDPSRRAFNQYGVEYITEQLRRPGTLVGFHPEGTRNKTDEPYTLLRAHPGVGQIAYAAQPTVLPVFVLGLSNNLPRQVRGNFDGTAEPITMVFGKPVDLSSFYARPGAMRVYKGIADHLREAITDLGEQEREIRAREGMPYLGPPARRASVDAAA